MPRINVTLPAIGTAAIDFREESAKVFDLMGESEFTRLRKVAHLGVVASIFTGVNHSREEYMFLQCAVIQLLAKIHRGHYGLAVSGEVSLNGIAKKISSGEELLKSWALLGNYGHAKFTYGTERGLLTAARDSQRLRRWLTPCKNLLDLRRWCEKTINDFVDEDTHWIIALRRLEGFHGKTNQHYIRNLVLPIDELFVKSDPAYAKLYRLRRLYGRVRHLCMAALDSYYSAQPVTIRLNSALLGFANLTPSEGGETTFDNFLARTNAWLAEELYLHPKAIAVLTAYEKRASQRISNNFSVHGTEEKRRQWLSSLVADGIGKPKNQLVPLFRIQLSGDAADRVTNTKLFASEIVGHTGDLPRIRLVANKNSFNRRVYVDALARTTASVIDGFRANARMIAWLSKFIVDSCNAQINEMIKLVGENEALVQAIGSLREGLRKEELEKNLPNIHRIFSGILQLLLKPDLIGTVMNFEAKSENEIPIFLRIIHEGETVFDNVSSGFEALLAEENELTKSRHQEITAVQKAVGKSRADFLFVCTEKFEVQDVTKDYKSRDDWDGLIVEYFVDRVRVTIVEAKTSGTRTKRENDSFKQLGDSRDFIRLTGKAPYRRRRIPGLGAYLRYEFPI